MRLCITTMILLLAGFAAIAEPIMGTKTLAYSDDIHSSYGPRFFGHLPGACIEEIATTSEIFELILFHNSVELPIPMPVYGDGTVAALSETIFTVEMIHGYGNIEVVHLETTWNGGNTCTFANLADEIYVFDGCSIEIKVWAFRQGSVGAAPLDFGALKSMFE